MSFLITPLIVYLLGGFSLGWIGGRVTAPETGMVDWKPGQHAGMMTHCRRLCDQNVLRYEPQTGDCVCRSKRIKLGE